MNCEMIADGDASFNSKMILPQSFSMNHNKSQQLESCNNHWGYSLFELPISKKGYLMLWPKYHIAIKIVHESDNIINGWLFPLIYNFFNMNSSQIYEFDIVNYYSVLTMESQLTQDQEMITNITIIKLTQPDFISIIEHPNTIFIADTFKLYLLWIARL